MLRRLSIFLLLSVLNINVSAQGITFTQDDWSGILRRASVENKMIFVDCYATWCGPCKVMDNYVFSDKIVGSFADKNFITVRVQMDSTQKDDTHVRGWREQASSMMRQYNVTSFPTMLFFSPKGKLVHRGVGSYAPADFIELLADAVNPDRQYYVQMQKTKVDKMPPTTLKHLATMADRLGDKKQAALLARQFIDGYLLKAPDSVLFERSNIMFLTTFITDSHQQAFSVFQQRGACIDSSMAQKGYSCSVAGAIMRKETVQPYIESMRRAGLTPDWQRIGNDLQIKYKSPYIGETMVNAKIDWFDEKKEWDSVVKYSVARIDAFGYDTTTIGMAMLNNTIFSVIFAHSQDTTILRKAINWMEDILWKTRRPTTIDTYANLLYKVGDVANAKQWQQVAILVDEKNAALDKRKPDYRYQQTLDKMKQGLPTW
ncbi:thioredoxin family protein [Chitinophaga sp. S165]|uniref:thioredoxin family protein n=1 Tax=Chitinophaga sp. S165 TaxID=2135462 RepID=UPI000D70F3BF|nr:thioredoxin family protein [Chitinophaga sp. S165]PWV47103.1 thioredoxin-like protein [Chitinophaga sp. S165]